MRTAVALFFILSLYSCSRNIYLQSPVYAPQLVHRGEADVQCGFQAEGGYSAAAAFAVTNHIHIQAQGNSPDLKYNGNYAFGAGYRWHMRTDSVTHLLAGLTVGYASGKFQDYTSAETGLGVSGFNAIPGYVLIDMRSRYRGPFFQYVLGIRSDRKLSLYTGTRIQWLLADDLHYTMQQYVNNGNGFSEGAAYLVNPAAADFSKIADVYIGGYYGWKRLQFFMQVQWRYQYTGVNLNNTVKPHSRVAITTGIVCPLGKRKE
ncbi:MAG: hypothetical protein Fur0041_06700 [Bacteroidia bacterium]